MMHARAPTCSHDVFRRAAFLGREVFRRAHRVHPGNTRRRSVERRFQRCGVVQVATRHLNVLPPGNSSQFLRVRTNARTENP